MSIKRSPILGYNHNFKHRGLLFHVQTEDSGVDNPHLFTHLFHGGVILSSRRLDYDADAAEDVVKSLMQAQHKAVLRDLRAGTFDDKISAYFGDHPDLEPAAGQAPSAGGTGVVALSGDAEGDTTDRMPAVAAAELVTGLGDATEEMPALQLSRSRAERAATIVEPLPPDHAEEPPAPPPPPRRTRPTGDPVVTFRSDAPAEEPAASAAEVSAAFRALRQESGATPAASERPQAVPSEISGEASAGVYSQVRRRASQAPPVPSERASQPPPVPPERARQPPPVPQEVDAEPTDRLDRRHPPRRQTPAQGSSSVVVSRPAVIIGAPPKVVGSRRPPTPTPARRAREDSSLFGQDLISEKSLDEVILAYLSEDSPDE